MADGIPKDYSIIYSDETPISSTRTSISSMPTRSRSPPPPPPPRPQTIHQNQNGINNNNHNHNRNNQMTMNQPKLPPPVLPPTRQSKSLTNITQHQPQPQPQHQLNYFQSNTNHATSATQNDSHVNDNVNLNRSLPYSKPLDGSCAPPQYRESYKIDLNLVAERLKSIDSLSRNTLTEHYYTVFPRRGNILTHENQPNNENRDNYRVYIEYSGEKDTYVVKVNHNSLKAIKNKMPVKGHYRYFFRSCEDTTYDELESDTSIVPYHDKDGQRHIYCRVFPAAPLTPPTTLCHPPR